MAVSNQSLDNFSGGVQQHLAILPRCSSRTLPFPPLWLIYGLWGRAGHCRAALRAALNWKRNLYFLICNLLTSQMSELQLFLLILELMRCNVIILPTGRILNHTEWDLKAFPLCCLGEFFRGRGRSIVSWAAVAFSYHLHLLLEYFQTGEEIPP